MIPTYYGVNNDIFKSLEGFNVISDDDPDEQDYTGDYWIIEREGKYGLVYPVNDTTFYVKIKPIYTSIKAHIYRYSMGDETLFWFAVEHENGLFGIFVNGEIYFKGFCFETLKVIEAWFPYIQVKEEGCEGYLDLKRVASFYQIEPVYYKGSHTIEWEDFDFLFGDVIIKNDEGLYALFTKQLEPLTDFIFEDAIQGTIHGEYSMRPRFNVLNKAEFFCKFSKSVTDKLDHPVRVKNLLDELKGELG